MHTLYHANCLDILPTIPDQSIDAVIADPPYPCIQRDYGNLSEDEWHTLMDEVVKECKRILKPSGSAVFILQPNRRRVGSMRLWMWEFLVRTAKEWNLIQDVYWWNNTALPYTKQDPNALRSSVKLCPWFGSPDAYRDGASVRWAESDQNKAKRLSARCTNNLEYAPSGRSMREERGRNAAVRNNGVTAFNLLPIPSGQHDATKHPAATPLALCEWWIRYISKPGDTILDPFAGASTVGVAAVKLGRSFIGIEKEEQYIEVSRKRLDEL